MGLLKYAKKYLPLRSHSRLDRLLCIADRDTSLLAKVCTAVQAPLLVLDGRAPLGA